MSTDINAVIEKKKKYGIEKNWTYVSSVDLPRNYPIFGRLARVRYYEDNNDWFEPRGFPVDASYKTMKKYGLIVEEGLNKNYVGNFINKKEAKELLKHKNVDYINEEKNIINYPDNHDASFLYHWEFSNVLRLHKKQKNGFKTVKRKTRGVVDEEYLAVKDFMNQLSKNNHEVRIVFWFNS